MCIFNNLQNGILIYELISTECNKIPYFRSVFTTICKTVLICELISTGCSKISYIRLFYSTICQTGSSFVNSAPNQSLTKYIIHNNPDTFVTTLIPDVEADKRWVTKEVSQFARTWAPKLCGVWLTIIGRSGLILGLHPANERRCYKVTPSLIGWAQTQNPPCRWFW